MEAISFLAGVVSDGVRSIGSRGARSRGGEETGGFDALLARAMTPDATEATQIRPRPANGPALDGAEVGEVADDPVDVDAGLSEAGSDDGEAGDADRLLDRMRFSRGSETGVGRIPFGAIARAVTTAAVSAGEGAQNGEGTPEVDASGPAGAATLAGERSLAEVRSALLPDDATETGPNPVGSLDEGTASPDGGAFPEATLDGPAADAPSAAQSAAGTDDLNTTLAGVAPSTAAETSREALYDPDLPGTDAAAAASGPNLDPRTPDRSLDRVDPELRTRLERVVDRMAREHGHDVEVVEGFRTDARQSWLFGQGRERPGPVVTWTQNSRHESGRAVDVRIDGSWDNPEAYRRLQTIAQEEGLATLGPRDPGHLELPASDLTASTGGVFRDGVEIERPSRIRTPLDAEGASRIASTTDPALRGGVARVARVADVAQVARVAEVATPGSVGFAGDASGAVADAVDGATVNASARNGVASPGATSSSAPAGAGAAASTPAFSGSNPTLGNAVVNSGSNRPTAPSVAGAPVGGSTTPPATAATSSPGVLLTDPQDPSIATPALAAAGEIARGAEAGRTIAAPGATSSADSRTSSPRSADAAVTATDSDARRSSSETSSDASGEGGEQSLTGNRDGSSPRVESPTRRDGAVGFGPTLANLQADGSSTSPIQEMRAASTLDRLEQIEALRDRAALGTSDGWRLRMADADGNGTRLDLGLRGSTVDARLGLSDPELARRAQANIAELRQSLETRGLDLEQALFRSGMSPDALESLTGPNRTSQSLDAMRAFMADLTGRPEDDARQSARRQNETSEQSSSGREPNDDRSSREETTP